MHPLASSYLKDVSSIEKLFSCLAFIEDKKFYSEYVINLQWQLQNSLSIIHTLPSDTSIDSTYMVVVEIICSLVNLYEYISDFLNLYIEKNDGRPPNMHARDAINSALVTFENIQWSIGSAAFISFWQKKTHEKSKSDVHKLLSNFYKTRECFDKFFREIKNTSKNSGKFGDCIALTVMGHKDISFGESRRIENHLKEIILPWNKNGIQEI